MSDRFTIGQLATEVGVPASTLRYYERADLLSPSGRTDGNYRIYDRSALERVRFIKVAQAAGFSLDDISTLMGIRYGVTAPCEDVEHLIEHRLTEVRTRLKDLREVERHLKGFRAKCRDSNEKGHCEVLDELTKESSKS